MQAECFRTSRGIHNLGTVRLLGYEWKDGANTTKLMASVRKVLLRCETFGFKSKETAVQMNGCFFLLNDILKDQHIYLNDFFKLILGIYYKQIFEQTEI